jgi:hypothetical protein
MSREGGITASVSGRSGTPDEKPVVAMVEGQQNLAVLSEEDASFLANFPPEAKKKVIRKIDVGAQSLLQDARLVG